MTIKVINMTNYTIELSMPIDRKLPPRETRVYDWVLYSETVNNASISNLLEQDFIRIENLDDGTVGDYVSQWNQEPKLRLTPYVFWVDSLGFYRMKAGDPTMDLDGVVIGPGAGGPVPPHGSTHVFNGTDPIPKIEVLEGAWGCTVTEQVGDAVFENVANSVRQADANSTANMPVIGVIINKPTPTTCIIARSGEVTLAGPLAVGQEYYASSTTPGQLTILIPVLSGQIAQYVGYAKNTTTLVVQLGTPLVRA